jgi:pimeloyl-ACP methyl ester carboxylesterase
MHKAIKGSRLEVLPDAGHLLNLEQPELFNQAIGDFLAGLS